MVRQTETKSLVTLLLPASLVGAPAWFLSYPTAREAKLLNWQGLGGVCFAVGVSYGSVAWCRECASLHVAQVGINRSTRTQKKRKEEEQKCQLSYSVLCALFSNAT